MKTLQKLNALIKNIKDEYDIDDKGVAPYLVKSVVFDGEPVTLNQWMEIEYYLNLYKVLDSYIDDVRKAVILYNKEALRYKYLL